MRLVILLCALVGVVLGATQMQKGTPVKQRKPSLPKKYLIEEGGYVKHRKMRSVGILGQYEMLNRHRQGRQSPGLRNGGGYLYNRPIYTPSDHLDARPALPLAEVESHPLSNFPAHYSGDLEDVPKDVKKEEKKADESAPATVPPKKDMDAKKKEEAPMKKTEAPKSEASARDKSEPQLVTKAQAPQQIKTTPKPATEATPKKKEEKIQITQQETVSGKPPVAVE
ncbi:uncharacterized protein LOC100898836 [Galendromus occidentalis]|uniref:Uncharacterized protein LOC100898836 n=1 Tax=Galendromus occidentalis TaxID=34638 RepID=A0AAJ6QSR3_9ACAR|nr:uncharacterized protein LOC100898836 [Galendromus occidentalis]